MMQGIDPVMVVMVVVIVVAAVVVFVFSEHRKSQARIVAARITSERDPSDEMVRQVSVRRTLHGHVVTWPRTWCDHETAADRGADIVNELWDDEQPLPISSTHNRWRQESRR